MKSRLDRRSFLRALSAAAAFSALPRAAHAARPGSCIVIGAGMSGLAAATMLRRAGVETTVIEARTRPGGRIWSDSSIGAPVEFGAGWIEGLKGGNPIRALAKELKLRLVVDADEYLYYGRDGVRRPTRAFERNTNRFQRAMTNYIEEQDRDLSLYDAALGSIGGVPTSVTDLEAFYSMLESLEDDFAGDSRRLSAFHFDDGGEFPGNDGIVIGGYQQIPNALAASLPIRYGVKATSIRYGSSGVTVTTDAGDLSADVAVVTLPLGILRSGEVSFDPVLPDRKTSAIQSLEMGVLNRVVMRFPKVFWPARNLHFEQVTTEENAVRDFLNLLPVTKLPILNAFVSGNFALALEQFSDDEVVGACVDALRSMFGSSVPDPVDRRLARWSLDPFTRGSYSFVPTGSSSAAYDILAEPVDGKLFFAGEATNGKYSATVHGAYLSGMREAARILAL